MPIFVVAVRDDLIVVEDEYSVLFGQPEDSPARSIACLAPLDEVAQHLRMRARVEAIGGCAKQLRATPLAELRQTSAFSALAAAFREAVSSEPSLQQLRALGEIVRWVERDPVDRQEMTKYFSSIRGEAAYLLLEVAEMCAQAALIEGAALAADCVNNPSERFTYRPSTELDQLFALPQSLFSAAAEVGNQAARTAVVAAVLKQHRFDSACGPGDPAYLGRELLATLIGCKATTWADALWCAQRKLFLQAGAYVGRLRDLDDDSVGLYARELRVLTTRL